MINGYDEWKTTDPRKEITQEHVEEIQHEEYLARCWVASGYIDDAINYLETLKEFDDLLDDSELDEMIKKLEQMKEGL